MMYEELVKNLRENVKDGCSDCTETAPLILQAADAIENLQDKFKTLMDKYIRLTAHTEWIPVTERLPEIHTNVLVVDKAHDMAVGSLEKIWDSIVWICPFSAVDDEDCKITHWMPLPEPPESEGE